MQNLVGLVCRCCMYIQLSLGVFPKHPICGPYECFTHMLELSLRGPLRLVCRYRVGCDLWVTEGRQVAFSRQAGNADLRCEYETGPCKHGSVTFFDRKHVIDHRST